MGWQNESGTFTHQKHRFYTIKAPLLSCKSGALKMVYITY